MIKETQFERYHPDDATVAKAQGRSEGTCFVCSLVAQYDAGASPVHIVFEDGATIAFLDPYPRRYGYMLGLCRMSVSHDGEESISIGTPGSSSCTLSRCRVLQMARSLGSGTSVQFFSP